MQCSALLRRRLASSSRYGPYRNLSNLRASRTGATSVNNVHLIDRRSPHRDLSFASIPTVLLPPVVFGGLLISLWTYKCLMMIIFQNKIIYMPSMPPFSRSEKVEDYANQCKPIVWAEHNIKSLDGTKLAVLEGAIPNAESVAIRKNVIVVYFQGNGSSLPPRLPYISNILKLLHRPKTDVRYTVIALSYRGFWKSKGRPSQRGIQLDAQAALNWVSERYGDLPNAEIVLWGQSIGAGVATIAAAAHIDEHAVAKRKEQDRSSALRISGLLLETPFTSLRAMLIALYPQKFLPYRYLGPFLMSTWDSEGALSSIGQTLMKGRDRLKDTGEGEAQSPMRVLLLEAGDDELVPKGDAAKLKAICEESRAIGIEHRIVDRALHTDVMTKGQGKKEITHFLKRFGRDA